MKKLRIREVKYKMHTYINNMVLAFTVMVWGGVLKINI